MSLLRVDARFVLPHVPRRTVVLGVNGGWAKGLAEAGLPVGVDPPRGASPELAVASVERAADAVRSGAEMVLVEGRGGRKALAGSFPVVRRFLPVPSLDAPHVLVALEHRRASVYALEHWSLTDSWRKRLRNRLAGELLARGRLPEVRPVTTLGLRRDEAPFFVRAGEPLGVPQGAEWFLTFGGGDVLSRGVFHLFAPGSTVPSWVLKFGRVAGYRTPFDRDERGLGLAREAGGVIASHAPRLLGRMELEGLHASLETAAPGARLTHVLLGSASRPAKLQAVEQVAAWLIDVGRQTLASPERLDAERARLVEDVLPAWSDRGLGTELLDGIPAVPAVLQHNDVGTWNVVRRADGFTVVDWESARRYGFPLWDLVYFLTDALQHSDGMHTSPSARDAHNLRLFRGELPSSELLFRWVRRAAEAFAVPPDAVGPLVTLCWLHHGLSHVPRGDDVSRHAPEAPAPGLSDAARIARLWLDELGPAWDAWRRI